MYVKILQSLLSNNRIQCNICARQCQIPATEGARGYCSNFVVRGGRLELSRAGYTPMRYRDPLSRLPVLGFRHPDTEVLSFGGTGCNFRCPWCWNASYAWRQADEFTPAQLEKDSLSPEGAVGLAKRLGVKGIAFSNSEPATLFPWVLETMRLAKDARLFTVWSTNGSATTQALELAIPTLDVFRVGIKGPQAVYDRIAPGVRLEDIQRTTEFVHNRGVHIEVVVSVTALGDSETWFEEISNWVKEKLGVETPLHFEVIYPAHKWIHPAPSRQTIQEAVKMAQDAGLRKVYIYDIGG